MSFSAFGPCPGQATPSSPAFSYHRKLEKVTGPPALSNTKGDSGADSSKQAGRLMEVVLLFLSHAFNDVILNSKFKLADGGNAEQAFECPAVCSSRQVRVCLGPHPNLDFAP